MKDFKRGHSVITFAIKGEGEGAVHQNENLCEEWEKFYKFACNFF